jgi:hypothetical protein
MAYAPGLNATTTLANLPTTATAGSTVYVTDGAFRGPYIWIPSIGWKDLQNGTAQAKYFGAKFDGTTDDTAALQSAIDELGKLTVPSLVFQSSAGTFQGGNAAIGAGKLVLPTGTAMITSLIGKHRIMIEGQGDGTLLRQIAATTGPMIRNRRDNFTVNRGAWSSVTAYSIGDGVTYLNDTWIAKTAHTNVTPVEGATWTKMIHASYMRLRDFQMDGNKANQTAANHGIWFQGDTQNNYTNPADEDYDIRCRVQNVYIRNTKGNGINMDGAGGNYISGVLTRNCDGYGIASFQDNNIDHCETAWSGLAGLTITGDSCRITNHKSWFNGQVTPASGNGYYITADSGTMSACAAQDNKAAGFFWDGAYGWSCQALEADSNNTSVGGYPAYDFNNSAYVQVQGIARNRYNAANTAANQNIAVRHRGSSDYNDISVVAARAESGWGMTLALTSDSVKLNSSIVVNNAPVSPSSTTNTAPTYTLTLTTQTE